MNISRTVFTVPRADEIEEKNAHCPFSKEKLKCILRFPNSLDEVISLELGEMKLEYVNKYEDICRGKLDSMEALLLSS